MQRIIVINTKGGCGKTTISTNLASLYASKGENTALYDYDTQSSSMRWMQTRGNDQEAADIHGVMAHKKSGAVTNSWHLRMPPETERVIVDTPPRTQRPRPDRSIKRGRCHSYSGIAIFHRYLCNCGFYPRPVARSPCSH